MAVTAHRSTALFHQDGPRLSSLDEECEECDEDEAEQDIPRAVRDVQGRSSVWTFPAVTEFSCRTLFRVRSRGHQWSLCIL